MTPLAALALAVRDRLTAGAEAPLPGIGTLACAHISARVRVRPDGQRVMLPPGESVGLLARQSDPTDLAQAVARHAGAAPTAAAGALRTAVDQLDARLAITGDARLDGVGVFQRTSSGVRFAAAPELLAAVNRPYEGLVPVPLAPADTPAAPPGPVAPLRAVPEPVAPVHDSPPGAVDILLDLIVNEPTEAVPPSAPSQSTFADDPLPAPDAAEGAEPIQHGVPDADVVPDEPEWPATAEDAPAPEAGAPAEDDEPAEIAVPFGDEPLRDLLPPTPDEPDGWQPAPHADVDGGARPLDRPTMEEAEQVKDAQTADRDDGFDDAEPGLSPDLELAAMDASVAGGAEPPRTSEPHATPSTLLDDIYSGDPPQTVVSPAARSAQRGWAFLYAATVLALSALVLYWFMAERRPPVVTPTAPAQPAATARPAPLAADSAALDSIAAAVLAADSLASPDQFAPAARRP